MKKLIALLLALVMILSLAACASTGNGEENKGGETAKKTIAVVAKGESHAFWQAVKAGAEKAAIRADVASS